MSTPAFNLKDGQRAQRKLLITVAEWGSNYREILGVRTEDSSIEFNIDSETTTDILGISYSDVNKTEPQQTLDPHYIVGKSSNTNSLDQYLTEAALKNDIDAYNGVFDIYIIAAFINGGSDGVAAAPYYAVKHSGCSIFPTAIGGDSYTSMPLEVHFSNNITEGSVNKLTADFTFTELVSG